MTGHSWINARLAERFYEGSRHVLGKRFVVGTKQMAQRSQESHKSQLTQGLTSVAGLSISSPKKAIIGTIYQYDGFSFRLTGFS